MSLSEGAHRAVVTGASAGLGAAIARRLAARGCDLVLTARRADRLEALAGELREDHGIDVVCVPLDLTEPGAPARLAAEAFAGGPVDIVINNAGFAAYGPFVDGSAEQAAGVVQLNVGALVELTHRFAERMRAADRPGYIGNISSMLSKFSVPHLAVYAGTKAFVRSFSEAVAAELRGTPVSVTCVLLGATATEFYDVARIEPRALYRPFVMSADRAARVCVRAVLGRRRTKVPGVLNHLVSAFAWLAPRRFGGWVISRLLGRPRPALPEGQGPR